MKSESLGIIEPKFFKFEENFELESGKILKGFEIIYETYGELNKDKSNAVLICHALSGITLRVILMMNKTNQDGGIMVVPIKPLIQINILLSPNNLGGVTVLLVKLNRSRNLSTLR